MSERDLIINELRQLAETGTTVGGMITHIKNRQHDATDRDVMLYFQDAFLLSPSRATAALASFPRCPDGIDAGNATMWLIPEIVRRSAQWCSCYKQSTESGATWLESVSVAAPGDATRTTRIRRRFSEEGWAALPERDQDALQLLQASHDRLTGDLQIVSCLCEHLQARLAEQNSR